MSESILHHSSVFLNDFGFKLQEDTPHEVIITPPSSATTDKDEIPQVESRSDDPELETAMPGNLTSIAGDEDEEEEEEAQPKKAKSSTVTSPSSLNTTSNGSLSIDTGIEKNASSSSYLESLRGTIQKTTEGTVEASGPEIVMEDTTAPSPAVNSSQLLTMEGLKIATSSFFISAETTVG